MSKRAIFPTQVMTNGAMSGTSKISSTPLDIVSLSCVAFQATWTGTATGSFFIEGSLDGTNYADLGVSILDAAGSADFRVINLGSLAVRYVRMTYVNATSTGTLNITAAAKGA